MLLLEKIKSMDSAQKASFLKLIEEKGTEYGIYPVSLEQKSIWFLYKRDIGKDELYYNIRFCIRITGNVSRDEAVKAIDRTIDADPILKARFFEIDNRIFQYVARENKYFITFEPERMNGIFDLEKEGPFRCCITSDEKGHLLDIAVHHIAADGFSVGVFFEEFKKALGDEEIHKKGISYFEYSLSQQSEQMKEKRRGCIAYWKDKLKNTGQIVTFPTDMPRKDYTPMPSRCISVTLDSSETSAVKEIIRKHRLTSYSFYLAVISNILRTFGRTPEIIFASSYLNRNEVSYEDMIGIRANMLVQRVSASKDEGFCRTAKKIQQDMFDGMGNMEIGIDEMLDCFEKVNIRGFRPCYQVLYSIRKSKHYINGEAVGNGDIRAEFIMERDSGADSFDYDMSFSVYEYEDTSEISLSYHSGLYSDNKAQIIADAVKESIGLIIKNDEKSCGEYIPEKFEGYSLSLKEKTDAEMERDISRAIGCYDIYAYTQIVDNTKYCVLYYTGSTLQDWDNSMKEKYGILIPIYVDCMPYDIDRKVNAAMLRLMFDEQTEALINACRQLIYSGFDKDMINVVQTDISGRTPEGEIFSVFREAVKSEFNREYYFLGSKKTYFRLKQKYHDMEYKGTADTLAEFLKGIAEDDKETNIFVEADENTNIQSAEKMISGNAHVKVFNDNVCDKHISHSIINIYGDGSDPVGKMTNELFSCENYSAVSYDDGKRCVYIRNGVPASKLRYTIKCGVSRKADTVDIRSIYDSIASSFITICSEDRSISERPVNVLSDTEGKVLEIWKKNLENENIGIYDKLFEIGGNSYNCMNILNDLISEGYEGLKITDLFSCNSVYTLSKYIDSIRSDKQSEEDTDTIDLMF